MEFEYQKKILLVDNYKQIKQLSNDLIELENISIYGTKLVVLRLDSKQIILRGNIEKIILKDEANDLQNKDEKG